jgi:trk system potassium uptake protein TrkH
MSRFDALNHAMSTVATGGLSTHDASFGYFKSLPLLWAATFFMTLSSLPFSILILFVVRGRLDALARPADPRLPRLSRAFSMPRACSSG